MPSNDADTKLYEELRILAAQNPRAARMRIEELMERHVDLEAILNRMSAPGEGRLRQLVANLARSRSDRSRFATHFKAWLLVETDQFARRAIASALDEARPAPVKSSSQRQLAARDLVDMYRYVAERLRHELQNALLGPKTRLLQLSETIGRLDEGMTRGELESLLGQLRDEFQSIGRLAEFEPNDEYFSVRPIKLGDWLDQMGREYAKRYSRIDLRLEGSEQAKSSAVLGSDYLLRLIFWNVWVNAHQAVGNPCSIVLNVDRREDALIVVVLDNGKGLPEELTDIAFRERYSSRSANRGRGLLEVQDAIQQLHGDAQLIEWRPREYRVQLTFSTKGI
jgi:signal transduction histidine kinase